MILDHDFGIAASPHAPDNLKWAGRCDPRIKPLARLGHFNYTYVDKEFEMRAPATTREGSKGSPAIAC